MTDYRFDGTQRTSFPQFLHPEREGGLVADPGEIIDFGDELPPLNGQWSEESVPGEWVPVLLEEEPAEEPAAGAGTGTGAAADSTPDKGSTEG